MLIEGTLNGMFLIIPYTTYRKFRALRGLLENLCQPPCYYKTGSDEKEKV